MIDGRPRTKAPSYNGRCGAGIIDTVRRRRFLLAAAVLATLTACDQSTSKPDFNPTPKPTRPGQAVIIAGDSRLNGDPEDGEYAVRTSANSTGGLAAAADGSIYFPVLDGPQHTLARITKDGRLHRLPYQTEADRLAISGDTLWLMSSGSAWLNLESVPLSRLLKNDPNLIRDLRDGKWPKYLQASDRQGKPPVIMDGEERSRRSADQPRKASEWGDVGLVLRSDGSPIVVSRAGELFQALGDNKVRRWSPPGYAAALKKASNGSQFEFIGANGDGHGNIAILGKSGMVHLPASGAVSSTIFPEPKGPLQRWTSALPLSNGSTVLLGSESSSDEQPQPGLVTSAGQMYTLAWGKDIHCREFDGSLAAIRSAYPGGISRLSDGSYALYNRSCSQIYAFRLPERMTGQPLPKK
jgi:hypothetical protein